MSRIARRQFESEGSEQELFETDNHMFQSYALGTQGWINLLVHEMADDDRWTKLLTFVG